MAKTILKQLGTLSLAAALGQRTEYLMANAVQTYRNYIRLRLDLTVAGGAANGTLQNRGSLAACMNVLGLDDSGSIETLIDARAAKQIAEMFAPRPLNNFSRLATGAAAANTILTEMIPLHFGLPILGNPQETAFMEKDAKKKLRLLIEPLGSATAFRDRLLLTSDRTWTINALTAEVVQRLDPYTRQKPLFQPVIRQLASLNNIAAGAGQTIAINSDKFLAALLIQQTAGEFEVGDILTNIEVRSDRRVYYDGRISLNAATVAAGVANGMAADIEQTEFGGAVPTIGYHGINFCENGRLSNALNPAIDSNLRITFDAAVSATAGVNLVRVYGIELQRVRGLTADNIPWLDGDGE